MIYRTPELTEIDELVLHEIDELWGRLRYQLSQPRRWFGTLRQATVARAVQGSNSIEGYHASVEDVAAVLEDEEPLDADAATRAAAGSPPAAPASSQDTPSAAGSPYPAPPDPRP